MDDVMILSRGPVWNPVPCDEWSYRYTYPQGGESYRHFAPGPVRAPSTEEWAWMAMAISTCCPGAQAAVGPVLVGPNEGAGERLPGMVLIALVDNHYPLETAFHECFHEIRSRLGEFDEKSDLVEQHGRKFRETASRQADLGDLSGDEAAAVAFARWAVGHPDIVNPVPELLALWKAIKRGDVGSLRSVDEKSLSLDKSCRTMLAFE